MDIDKTIIKDIEQSRTDYEESVEIADGLEFNQKDLDKRVVYYTSNKYLSGNKDKNGKRKPYRQIINDKIELEASRTDVDVSSIDLISLDNNREATLILEQDFIKEADEINLNDAIQALNHVYIRYGGVIPKRIETADSLEIVPVNWISATTDQRDVWSDFITEEHEMTLNELQEKKDVYDNIDEIMKIAEVKKLKTVTVIEAEGFLDRSSITEDEADEDNLVLAKIYYAIIGGDKFMLFKAELPDVKKVSGSNYKYAARKPFSLPGRARGMGLVEEGMDAQISVNEAAIAESINAMYSGLVTFKTNSEDVETQIQNGLESGSAVFLKEGEYLEGDVLSQMNNTAHQAIYDGWENNIQKLFGSYEAATGEEGKVTPFRSLALKAKQAASTYDYRGEQFNSLVREIIKDWVLPYVVKRIKKEHRIQLQFNGTKGRILQNAISKHIVYKKHMQSFLTTGVPFDMERYNAELEAEVMGMFKKDNGTVTIPDSFYDSLLDSITIIIGDDLVDTKAQMNAMFEIWETTAPEDPSRAIIKQRMIELSNGISSLELEEGGALTPGTAGKGGKREGEPAISKEINNLLSKSQ